MCDRFWSKISVQDPNNCWPWAARASGRYAYFNNGEKTVLAHRFAYEQKYGKSSAKGRVVRHKCDNTFCCNPNHLVLGTHQDNMNDKIERGRARNLKGEECSWRKLNADQVIEIRALLKQNIYHKDIAKKFGVDTVTVTDINLKRTWKHL